MKSEHLHQIETLYRAALAHEPSQRSAFLVEACAGDEELRHEIESLLAYDERAGQFLEVPALEVEAKSMAADFNPSLIGQQLSHYRITEKIGSGGMGEVYRAHDNRLGRDVAVKISGDRFSERFGQEARVVAALNHPNICTLHDVGPNYLVMELVDGPTLAERLQQGPISLKESVSIAKQIAAALDAAHEAGIIHRDLKPGNIKIKQDGTVKVLDFGLAKSSASTSNAQRVQLPTLTGKTESGVIMGTPGYMSPEQARGKPVDKRTDIWAFGAVLYEMLTGRPAFEGETFSDTIAAVLQREPDGNHLPVAARHLVQRCLEKDPKQRLRDIGDAQWELDRIGHSESSQIAQPKRRGGLVIAVVSSVVLLAVALAFTTIYLRSVPVAAPEIRFEIPLTGMLAPSFDGGSGFSVSPDGQYLAYVGTTGGKRQIWLRPLGSLSAQPLAGSDNAGFLFWSPESRYIGFSADGKLKKIDIMGGPVQVLCDAPLPPLPSPGTWSRDGLILFSKSSAGARNDAVIMRVSASGGEPTAVTATNPSQEEILHIRPQFLPDGHHFLYTAIGDGIPTEAAVYIGSLDSKSTTALMNLGRVTVPSNSLVLYVRPGYLLFKRNNALVAQRFDSSRLTLAGEPVPIAEDINAFAASETGLLVYWGSVKRSQALWLDRNGSQLSVIGTPSSQFSPELSPDGRRAAVGDLNDNNYDVWVIDIDRGVPSRLTFDPSYDGVPIWSPDGTQIAFASGRDEKSGAIPRLYKRPANGTGSDELLFAGNFNEFIIPKSWSSDGQNIIFMRATSGKPLYDLWVLPLSGDRKPFPFLQSGFNKSQPRLSPDGRWLAYATNESGTTQIVVQSFPDPSKGKWQVSAKGGADPKWRRDGRELYFIALDGKLMAVPIKISSVIEAGHPSPLFQTPFPQPGNSTLSYYDVSSDGQRFLLIPPLGSSSGETTTSVLTAVVNWTASLKK